MILSRRRLFGLISLAAPAIVAAPSLMRISVLPESLSFSDLVTGTLRANPALIAEVVAANNLLFQRLQAMQAIQRLQLMESITGIPDLMRGTPNG